MSRLRVATIVEGHGEVVAVPILLRRIWNELLQGQYMDVLSPPIRQPRGKLAHNRGDALSKAIALAAAKLRSHSSTLDRELILVMIDADNDLPCALGPKLLSTAQASRSDKEIACVIANVEYETWFVAAAESLDKFLDLRRDEELPKAPEEDRLGKGWIQKRFRGTKYSETVDQAKLTARMDLKICRDRSPSFDKLCRILEKMKRGPACAQM